MNISVDALKQLARALGIPASKSNSREALQAMIDAVKRDKPFKRFDPRYASLYKRSDLALFARDMNIPLYAKGRARTRAQLLEDLERTRPENRKERRDPFDVLCGKEKELQQTRDQLNFVEDELRRLHEDYAKVKADHARKRAEHAQLMSLLGHLNSPVDD